MTSRDPKRSKSLKLNISKTVRNGQIATKPAHDGPQYSPHPRYIQGQGQGKKSRDTGTSVMSRNVCYTVPSDVLSLHALALWSTITLSFYYNCQAARCNVYITEWATPSFSMCQIAVNMVYKLQFCTFTIHNVIRTFIMVKPGNCPWQLQLSSYYYYYYYFSLQTKFSGQTRNLYRYGPQVDLRTLTHFQRPWPTFQGYRPIFVPKTRNFKSI